MSYEVFGDGDDMSIPEGYVTEDRANECFVTGLQSMREMLARFVEQGGDATTAMSIRANWNPSWGIDPGKPDEISIDCWGTTQGDLDRGWKYAKSVIEAHRKDDPTS